ncbi:M48 family metallopeptidase [Rhizobiaceae bacterium n13]|uniref:M48 family metallopeptidase n=1 Tax=Ferirhizobium litorale TaxID=2927786 RepID=A0AAE3U333_9HYPH|nr:SprT family zinc-dependent metalloprotease [Fererhizobium litorale]MDI7863031.1 M48 family metallopeptidase [Fererhizobium litorale]MDI7923292.1 M48 family metallopeptidase [Fererhizobium litorale]
MFSRLKKPKTVASPSAPERRMVDVAGRTMPLTIKQNARSTRITLRIEPGGRALKLTIPPGLAQREIDAFLDRHQGWLMTKLARFSTDASLRHGGEIRLRGVKHAIEHTGKLRGVTEAIEVGGRNVLRVSGLEEHMGRRIADFLKKEARRDLEALVARHAAAIRKPVTSISMKDTRSRWGSCSSEGNLSFSWRIVMAPPAVIDYLAAHEVAHLKEMNHGPRFWSLCERLCPHMEEAKAWLKRHGTMLHAIDFE